MASGPVLPQIALASMAATIAKPIQALTLTRAPNEWTPSELSWQTMKYSIGSESSMFVRDARNALAVAAGCLGSASPPSRMASWEAMILF